MAILSLAPPRWTAIVILAWHGRTSVIGSLAHGIRYRRTLGIVVRSLFKFALAIL